MTLEIFERRAVGPLACNCYVVGDPQTREAIVIDPGGDPDQLADAIASKGLTVTAIVATHAHFDHLLAAGRLRSLTGAPLHLHARDRGLLDWYRESGWLFLGTDIGEAPEIDTSPEEGDRLAAGSAELEVLHTPGHSPGSLTLVTDTQIFCGDALFAGSIGRSDLPGGDSATLKDSIEHKLLVLPDDTIVYPGHGPHTTVGREKLFNPFVGASPN